jgi:hypothetical protein
MRQGYNFCTILFLVVTLFSTGCFHKDVETDSADDIVANLIYTGPEGTLILSKEEIFQANSKESGGGVTHISGYTEYRLTSYDLRTGEQVGRVALGEMTEEANALLGVSPGKVWMFSIDPALGLHYRDPKTLEVKMQWDELSKKPGLGSFKPAHPEWPQIDQYFTYHLERNKVMLTDEAGFHYFLDPETFALEKTEAKMPRVEWEQDFLNSNGQFRPDDYVNLDGDPRKHIKYLERETHDDVSFLFGEFIIDNDPIKEAKRQKAMMDSLQNAVKAWKDSLTVYAAAHPEANASEPNYRDWSWTQREYYDHGRDLRRKSEDAEREIKSAQTFSRKVLSYPLLTTDGRSAYILHANMVADTAHCIVSRVNLLPDSTWKIAWDTHLNRFYHNPSKADQAGVFETVYSKGNPKFDYQWAGVSGNLLVLIWQLRMVCVNLEDGKIVWEKEM